MRVFLGTLLSFFGVLWTALAGFVTYDVLYRMVQTETSLAGLVLESQFYSKTTLLFQGVVIGAIGYFIAKSGIESQEA